LEPEDYTARLDQEFARAVQWRKKGKSGEELPVPNHQISDVKLDEESLCVLCVLAASPSLFLTQDDIQAASDISRNTISDRLRSVLKPGGLVQQKGERGGYTIIKDGLDKLRTITLIDRPKEILQGSKEGNELLREIEGKGSKR
jgi:hypothetical protein